MRRVMTFSPRQVHPVMTDVLRRQWMPAAAVLSPRLHALFADASAAFNELAAPEAVIEEVSREEFASMLSGDGEPATPLATIVPRARTLALFAATLGADLETGIRGRVGAPDAPSGFALDAFASAAAERFAEIVADEYHSTVHSARQRGMRVVPYSPGGCGWKLTGQRELFHRLAPAEIGIALNDRCLLQPTKSVLGVLVAGPRDLHLFKPVFPCCARCITRQCFHRMARLRAHETEP